MSSDSELKPLAEKFDFWFIPLVNPDGYAYSHGTDRLWRKTRSKNRVCRGTDPNRNYNFHWKESGASESECDITYAGPRPSSEPEVEAMSRLLDTNAKRIAMYITFHSFSQMIIYPYSYGRVQSRYEKQLRAVAEAASRALSEYRGTKYSYGTAPAILYPAAGGSDDYAHGHSGIKYSFTIELPDNGRYGFLLPAREIIPVGIETIKGVKAMIDKMAKLENL